MKIFTENLLLAFMAFMHFRRADGMDHNNFPARRIMITMRDGCTVGGHVLDEYFAPIWLFPNQAHPVDFVYYIKMPEKQYGGIFQEPFDLLRRHNPLLHTPDSVQIHIQPGEYYLAGPFEVYNVQQQEWLPPYNYIYVAVPAPQGQVHRALLRRQEFKKDEKRHNSIYPGTIPRRRRISPLGDYLLRMYHSH